MSAKTVDIPTSGSDRRVRRWRLGFELGLVAPVFLIVGALGHSLSRGLQTMFIEQSRPGQNIVVKAIRDLYIAVAHPAVYMSVFIVGGATMIIAIVLMMRYQRAFLAYYDEAMARRRWRF